MFIGYYNIANIITLAGLACALGSCAAASAGNFQLAVILLLGSCFTDMADGPIARSLKRNEKQRTFGVQIDTVCDIVSFGVAPAFLGYCFGLRGRWLVLLAAFACCGALRLAYFNTLAIHDDAPAKGYKGLPIPVSSALIPAVLWLSLCVPDGVFLWILAACYALLGVLYILNIDVIKPKGKIFFALPVIQLAQLVVYIIYGGALNK